MTVTMDDFTPPPPRPRALTGGSAAHHQPPPPIPPPPRDLPDGYRASTDNRRPSTAVADMHQDRAKYYDPPLSPSLDGSTDLRSPSGSFRFLARSKSGRHEVPVVTSAEGRSMLRKSKLKEQEEARQRRDREEARAQRQAPSLPSHGPFPIIDSFGGEDERSSADYSTLSAGNRASNFSRPVPPQNMAQNSSSMPIISNRHHQQSPPGQYPASAANLGRDRDGAYVDAHGQANKHYSVASTAVSTYNSPRRVRRRKDPTPFNILIVGAKTSGKSSLIDFLKSSLALPADKQLQQQHLATPKMSTTNGSFTSHYVESEFEGERVGITLWDSQGLERNLVDLQIREMASFIESKFEDTFNEESKVNRSPGSRDTHIHCVFLVLDPANLDMTLRSGKAQNSGNAFAQARGPSGLSQELDMQVMKGLAGKTTVIPIISKADTLTGAHIRYLKRAVWNSIQAEKLDPLDALGLEESESDFDEEDEQDLSDFENGQPVRSQGDSDSDDAKYDRLNIDDSTTSYHNSPHGNKTRSSATTPSPAQPKHRPTRSITPANDAGSEDIYIPFTLLAPDPYEQGAIGRRFPWGVADPYNPEHCDFVRLRESVFSEWRTELRSAAREKWYETWRTSRLAHNTGRARQPGGVDSSPGHSHNGGGSPPPVPMPVAGYSPSQQHQGGGRGERGNAGLGLYAGSVGHRQGVADNTAF